jgi:outer membrane biosynthesis protein TonB
MPSDHGQYDPRVEPRLSAPTFEDDDDLDPRIRRRPRRNRWLAAVVALAALTGFAGIAWYATSKGRQNPGAVAPLITAERDPVKERPVEPGGMEVPNRNLQVFNRMNPDAQPQRVERLLPPAEAPVARPAPEPEVVPPVGPLVPNPPPLAKREEPAPPVVPAPDKTAKTPEPPPVPPTTTPKVTKAPAAKEVPKAESSQTEAAAPAASAMKKSAAIPTGAWRVQLGAARDEARAKAAAQRVQKANGDLLGALSADIVRADLGAKGIFYRMRMGPLADRAAADDLCRKLKARKVGCLVIKP